MRTQSYQIANKTDSRKIAGFLSKDGQLLLPFLELICNTEQAVDELIDGYRSGSLALKPPPGSRGSGLVILLRSSITIDLSLNREPLPLNHRISIQRRTVGWAYLLSSPSATQPTLS